jgi:uncharacterized protein (TIRG00374 family)
MSHAVKFTLPLLLTLLLGYAVWRNIASTPGMESNDFWEALAGIRWGFVGLALAALALSNFTGCLQWKQLLAKQKIAMTYKELLRFFYVGLFFNNFMPGNVGGDVKKIYDIHTRSSETVGAAVSATLFDRLFGLYALNILALVVGALFVWKDPSQRFFVLPSLWVFVGFSVFLALLFSRRLGRVFHFMGKRARHLQQRFLDFRDARLLLQVISLSGVTQILRVLSHFFCGMALGVEIAVSWYFYYIPMIAMVSALPISIGGFGPRELLAQKLFALAGVGSMQAVLVQLLAYLANLVVSLLGALEFLGRKSEPQKSEP